VELIRRSSEVVDLPDFGAQPVVLDVVGSELGESPRWDPVTGNLWWVDIAGLRLHCLESGGLQTTWDLDVAVGAVLLTDSPRVVLAAADGFHLFDPEADRSSLITELESALPLRRMNDAGVDPSGRIYAGTMRWDAGSGPDDGILYRLDGDGGTETLLSDLGCPNGVAWPRNDLFAFIDSLSRRIDFWAVDVSSGSLTGLASSIDTSAFEGIPDGMTLDSDGRLWVAFWGGGVVRSFDPEGAVSATIAVGTRNVSSVCFGGDDLRTLFITTAVDPEASGREASDPADRGGSLFACRPGATGRAPFRWHDSHPSNPL
jgi:sugar lactone lactonase YvrE